MDFKIWSFPLGRVVLDYQNVSFVYLTACFVNAAGLARVFIENSLVRVHILFFYYFVDGTM